MKQIASQKLRSLRSMNEISFSSKLESSEEMMVESVFIFFICLISFLQVFLIFFFSFFIFYSYYFYLPHQLSSGNFLLLLQAYFDAPTQIKVISSIKLTVLKCVFISFSGLTSLGRIFGSPFKSSEGRFLGPSSTTGLLADPSQNSYQLRSCEL